MRHFWIDTDTASDDAVAILMALRWPDVQVDGMCAGDTVPDPYHMWINHPLTNVCLDIDSPRLLALYRERLTR